MDDTTLTQDVALPGIVASAILQAVKRWLPTEFYPVVLMLVGGLMGALVAYSKGEGALQGAIKGAGGAIGSAGVYSLYTTRPSQPRDDKGRFKTTKKET